MRRRQPPRPAGTVITGEFVAARVLELTREADAAAARVTRSGDTAALHDLRVAVRRLRSWLRAHRQVLQVPRGLRRDLRDLMRASSTLRDAEAWRERLVTWRAGFRPVERQAARRVARATSADVAGERATRRECARRWRALAPAVRATVRAARAAATDPYGPVLAGMLGAHLARLQAAERTARDVAGLHRVRIEAKRLRYLLEPCATWHPAVADVLISLRGIQDLLGEINDCAVGLVRLERLAGAANRTALREPRAPLPGPLVDACVTLARAVQRRQARLLTRRSTGCTQPVAALTTALAPFRRALRAGNILS